MARLRLASGDAKTQARPKFASAKMQACPVPGCHRSAFVLEEVDSVANYLLVYIELQAGRRGIIRFVETLRAGRIKCMSGMNFEE